MPRVSSFLLALSLLTIPVSAQSPSTPVDVAYVLTTASLQTYDVDPTTGVPTAEGQPITLPTQAALVVPSADDHFLYVLGLQDKIGKPQRLWVYSTDSLGVPHRAPLQILGTPAEIVQFKIDPTGRLAYASDFTGKIWLFTIDPKTGLVGNSRIVATSKHNGPCGTRWFDSGLFLLDGFNSDGSRLYDEWDCISFDTYGAHYYLRRIDRSTGKLGPNREIFVWGNSGGGGDSISFTKKSMIDFYNSGGGPDNAVNVYPPGGGSKPLFSCYVTMLQACGYASSAYADPLGKYLFLQISNDVAQIARVDMTTKTIVDTGNFVPQQMTEMSPDRILLYTTSQDNPNVIPIYVFDPQTGAVQQGGTIQVFGPKLRAGSRSSAIKQA